jgi:hypothetical protein
MYSAAARVSSQRDPFMLGTSLYEASVAAGERRTQEIFDNVPVTD